jgi:hypothetical protein
MSRESKFLLYNWLLSFFFRRRVVAVQVSSFTRSESYFKRGQYVLLAFFISSLLIFSNNASAAFNTQINYQGKLTNASNVSVSDGSYNMEFKLYTVSSGGAAIWTETRTGGNTVTVTNGLFSVMLGSVSALTNVDFNQTLYLGVNIGGIGTPSWDGEMTPRKVLGAVPAAFYAKNVISDGRIDLSYAPADATNPGIKINYAPSVSSANNAISVLTGANVTGAALQVNAAGIGDLASLDSSNASANGVSIDLQSSSDSQYIFKATSGNGSINALYVSANGRVGIGSTNPQTQLHITAAVSEAATLTLDPDDGQILAWQISAITSGNALSLQVAGTERFNLGSAGNFQMDGDLTVSGDDLFMGTNTAGFILVADGTNFNPVAVSGDPALETLNGRAVVPEGHPA